MLLRQGKLLLKKILFRKYYDWINFKRKEMAGDIKTIDGMLDKFSEWRRSFAGSSGFGNRQPWVWYVLCPEEELQKSK